MLSRSVLLGPKSSRGLILYNLMMSQHRYFVKKAFQGLANAVSDLTSKKVPVKETSTEDQMLNEVLDKLVGKKNPISTYFLKSGLKIFGNIVKKAITQSGQDIEHIFNTANALILKHSSLFGEADVRLGVVTSFNSANINGRATTTISSQVMSSNPSINNGVATIRATKVGKSLR